jgi:hypothetical protein
MEASLVCCKVLFSICMDRLRKTKVFVLHKMWGVSEVDAGCWLLFLYCGNIQHIQRWLTW